MFKVKTTHDFIYSIMHVVRQAVRNLIHCIDHHCTVNYCLQPDVMHDNNMNEIMHCKMLT